MKLNTFVALAFSLSIAACATKNTNRLSVEDVPIPKSSIAFGKRALGDDMLSSVNLYVQSKLNCKTWTLEKVTDSEAIGQIVFTSEGQLYGGEASEKWQIMPCGKTQLLRLRVTPDPQGGSIVRIANLS